MWVVGSHNDRFNLNHVTHFQYTQQSNGSYIVDAVMVNGGSVRFTVKADLDTANEAVDQILTGHS